MKKYKYFVFTDVHGEFMPLISELQDMGYDSSNPNHILISLGDNFDRGDYSYQVYKFLIENKAFMIKGNHESMLQDFLYYKDKSFDIINNGLDRTIVSFANMFKNTTKSKVYKESLNLAFDINSRHPELKNTIGQMPDGYKIDNYILTHAGFINSTLNHNHEEERWFPNNWANTEKFVKECPAEDKFKFVFGHWHAFKLRRKFLNEYGSKRLPFKQGNFLGLDAATNLTYKVNVFIIESDSKPIPFSSKSSLKEIKKMQI